MPWQSELSADLFKRSAVAIAREKRPVGEYILSLTDEEKMQFFDAEQEMEKCELSAAEAELSAHGSANLHQLTGDRFVSDEYLRDEQG
jgi:hypothetical protein